MREGYKQTEVGVFPEDWEPLRVGDSIEFKNGLNKAKSFFGFGTPIINYMDVFHNTDIGANNIKGLVSVTSDEKATYSARVGDLFFTRTSETVDEIGVSAVLSEKITDAVFSGFVLRGRDKPNTSAFELKFKKYCFQSEIVRQQIRSSASYTTRALTNGKLLSKVIVPTPSNPNEQKAIASALSDVDGLIASLEALIAKKRALKTATMQQLLTGKTRLDGFEIDWSIKKISDLGNVSTGSTPSTFEEFFWGGEFPWITPTDIGEKRDISSSGRNLTQLGLDQVRKVPKDAVLVTCIASIGKNAVLKKDGACNQQINFISINEEHCADFIYYLIEYNRDLLLANSGQTAVPIISKAAFSEIEICIPEKSEQVEIGRVLAEMDDDIQLNCIRLSKTKALKQGMMQELLTGRTRLV